MKRFCILLFGLIYLNIVHAGGDECPTKCTCKRKQIPNEPNWVKVRCGDSTPINSFEELELFNIANEIVQLNLSHNLLTSFSPKVQLLVLQKLDISNNHISLLENNQFIEVPNLRRLDISRNNIKSIETGAFSGLVHLERLKLNHNQISVIQKDTFNPLIALKQLDISNDPLICNCDLLWMLTSLQKLQTKLLSNPKCTAAPTFKEVSLKKFVLQMDLQCNVLTKRTELSVIELEPKANQIVFEGDEFDLQCSVLVLTQNLDNFNNFIKWYWRDFGAQEYFKDVVIETTFLNENGQIISRLKIKEVNSNHTGTWSCGLESHANYTKQVQLIVISDETKFCPVTTVATNKGTYHWPTTIVNYTISLPCASSQLNDENKQTLSYFCSSSGKWMDFNATRCPYVSENTKILEQFSKVNISLTYATAYESLQHFKNYTFNNRFKDPVDLFYAVKTIGNYISYLATEKDIGTILMDVLNNFLTLPVDYIEKSDVQYNTSSKIVQYLENIASFSPSSILSKANFAAEEFMIKQEMFTGMTCTWYLNKFNISDRLFYCITSNKSILPEIQNRVIEASIQIPGSLFYQIQKHTVLSESGVRKLLVSMLSNGKLFSLKGGIAADTRKITSAVVGVKLANISISELVEPIYIMLRTSPRTMNAADMFLPVWWNSTAENGKGNWSTANCELSHELRDTVVFFCNRLGYYGLLQNMNVNNYSLPRAKFHYSHLSVYVACGILFVSLFITLLTYALCYTAIQMPKKTKHSLVNIWLAVIVLIFVYTFGIYQMENVLLCKIVGLLLHYFTLVPLFWMIVGLTAMYKRLNKSDSIELTEDELSPDRPIQKPILGLYLVGWGIAMIICGISGAINMNDYISHDYCFLKPTPAFSALIMPVTFLLCILFILILCLRCTIYSTDISGHLSEGTQITENVDLELLDPGFLSSERHSVHSSSSKTRSSEIEDAEHGPSTQLKAYIIFLILYLCTWITCALSTTKLFSFKYEDIVFNAAFVILASILGSFTLFFYCVARNDVRTQYVLFRTWLKRKLTCFRSRTVSDAIPNIPQIQTHVIPNSRCVSDLHITSRSSSRSSNTKSNSNNSNALKAVANLNASHANEPAGTKVNNVNLINLHRQQYRVNNLISNINENTAQVFYDPYQSTVARRFFRKQRQNMMKRNNLMLKSRCENGNESSEKPAKDSDVFGTNSKVNNTNIHVEHIYKNRQKNLNVLSDSNDMDDFNDVPIEKLMINAERLRRKELGRHRPKKKQNVNSSQPKETLEQSIMRTVSQQCSLEYSSDSFSIPDIKFDRQLEGESSTNNHENPSSSAVATNAASLYVNPSYDLIFSKRVQSRASSVSASELDELYQQIRKGNTKTDPNVTYHINSRLSDPEIRFNIRDKTRISCNDNTETIV